MSKYRFERGTVDLDTEDVRDAKGRRITTDDAEALADEIEAHGVPGRPSLTAPNVQSPRISFRVSATLAERAAAVARRDGKSLSELGREALEQYLRSA